MSDINAAQEAYEQCYVREMTRKTDACEPMQQMAASIIAACEDELDDYRQAVAGKGILEDKAVEDVVETLRNAKVQTLVSVINEKQAEQCK